MSTSSISSSSSVSSSSSQVLQTSPVPLNAESSERVPSIPQACKIDRLEKISSAATTMTATTSYETSSLKSLEDQYKLISKQIEEIELFDKSQSFEEVDSVFKNTKTDLEALAENFKNLKNSIIRNQETFTLFRSKIHNQEFKKDSLSPDDARFTSALNTIDTQLNTIKDTFEKLLESQYKFKFHFLENLNDSLELWKNSVQLIENNIKTITPTSSNEVSENIKNRFEEAKKTIEDLEKHAKCVFCSLKSCEDNEIPQQFRIPSKTQEELLNISKQLLIRSSELWQSIPKCLSQLVGAQQAFAIALMLIDPSFKSIETYLSSHHHSILALGCKHSSSYSHADQYCMDFQTYNNEASLHRVNEAGSTAEATVEEISNAIAVFPENSFNEIRFELSFPPKIWEDPYMIKRFAQILKPDGSLNAAFKGTPFKDTDQQKIEESLKAHGFKTIEFKTKELPSKTTVVIASKQASADSMKSTQ
jgi:hypothetical protein